MESIIQCDNLKTGVEKHGRDEVRLNSAYRELAEHYGTAIIPARVRTPKDKAMVKGTVGVISTFILAAIRNNRVLSLNELNEAIFERLHIFNHKPFQKRDGSRATAFEEEKAFLLPLLAHALSQGMDAVIPPKKNRKEQREYDQYLYRPHHLVENCVLHLKRWRGIATRYAKTTDAFIAAV